MKVKTIILLTGMLSWFNVVNQAQADQPEPSVCPDVAAIKAIGVSPNAFQNSDQLWLTGRRDQKYGTVNNWTFIIGEIAAVSSTDAYNKATLALNSLKFELGPLKAPLGKWVCFYNTAQAYPAVAIYPPIATLKGATNFLHKN